MSCELLHRIDPAQNMARFYRVELLPDLFGDITWQSQDWREGNGRACHA